MSTTTAMSATSSISYIQLGKKQDHILKSDNNIDPTTDTYYTMIEVYDGHGEDDCIDCIRTTNTSEIITGAPHAPELALQMMLKKKKPFMPYSSGATFSCVKIFDTYIDCRSTGDSEIWVFKNGQCIYKSPNHIWSNLDEQERIKHIVQPIYCEKPELVSATAITLKKTACVKWNSCPIAMHLVPTQSLGHRGITGLQPAVKRIEFDSDDDIRVIIGSDGFWDMIMSTDDNEFLCSCLTAEELCKFAEDRWKQEWDFIADAKHPENVEKNRFEDFDDIAVGYYKKPTVCRQSRQLDARRASWPSYDPSLNNESSTESVISL